MPTLVVIVALAAALAALAGPHLSPWSTAQKIDEIAGNNPELNTLSVDGCPIESPDGLSLYMASNRPGSIESAPGVRSLDIWVAHRETRDAPFGAPVNLGPAVNSTADDFCPTPVRGHGLFFVSRRSIAGVTCGMGDIYFTRFNRAHGWKSPEHLGCAPASPVGVLNSAANDIQPNVSKEGREVVFSSNRPESLGQDIWVSVREHAEDPWSPPTRLGSEINTAAAETRPSLSRDAQRLYFGRAPGPEGMNDIYLATRHKLKGADR